MPRWLPISLCLLVLGCGRSADPPPAPPAETGPPALATDPATPGEIVLRGASSPRTHRTVALDGRYLVRFAQWAPEDADHSFAHETRFVAALVADGPGIRPRLPLFRAAAATGRRVVEAHGRYRLDVSFGDFPYVVRITPG